MIRKIARPALASVFIADGVDTLVNQKDHQEGARDLVARVRSVTPNPYLKYIPTDEKLVVQTIAGTKVAAGSLFALGKAPRLAATALVAAQLPTIVARHAFWETQDPKEKKNRRSGFITDLGLLGGLLLASADTDGKPGLAWRAQKAGQQVNKQVQAALPTQSEADKRKEDITDSLKNAGETLREKAEEARVLASDAFDKATDYVEENKDDWRKSIESFAGSVKDSAEDYRKNASQAAQEYRKVAAEEAKSARKQSAKKWRKFRKNM